MKARPRRSGRRRGGRTNEQTNKQPRRRCNVMRDWNETRREKRNELQVVAVSLPHHPDVACALNPVNPCREFRTSPHSYPVFASSVPYLHPYIAHHNLILNFELSLVAGLACGRRSRCCRGQGRCSVARSGCALLHARSHLLIPFPASPSLA